MRKALMIGLDGATFSLLKPLIEDGVMPYLGQFLSEGVHGDLMSTQNPLTPPAWISMITGRSPGVHGIYDFLRPTYLEDGTVFLRVNDSRAIRCETIWSMLNRHGKRATSLNFFGMSPAMPIDGYMISGFVPWKHLRRGIHPPSLFDTVKALPDFDYKDLAMDIGEEKKCVQGLMEGEHEDWIELQRMRDTAWTNVCCYLMERDRTELTAVVLDGPDKIQHLFWRYVDPELLERDPDEWYLRIRELCLDYYRQLDRNIQRMANTAGPQTDIIMTSDHGFGATTEIVYLNQWLAERGYLKWADRAESDTSGKLTATKIKDHLGMVDWKNTVAFCPTPSSNSIYIKKANDSSKGVTDAQYLEFCLTLKKELMEYRDPANGEAVFVDVILNKLQGTAYVDPAPDMTLRLRDGGFVSILKSPDVVAPRKHADGTHRPNGIFVGRGPSFKAGHQLSPLSLLDVAPLLLHLLEVPIPHKLEGRLPVDALVDGDITGVRHESGDLASHRDESVSVSAHDREPTPDEREALLQQLKRLGYMD